jgi:hypothetical protein
LASGVRRDRRGRGLPITCARTMNGGRWLPLFRALTPGGSLWIFDVVDCEVPRCAARRGSATDGISSLRGPAYRDEVLAYVEKEDTPRPRTYQLELLKAVGFTAVESCTSTDASRPSARSAPRRPERAATSGPRRPSSLRAWRDRGWTSPP